MKAKDIALYIAIGLGGLAIISIFVPINQGVLVGLSLSALLFTIAQTLDSQLAYLDEDTQAAIEVANKAGMLNISEKNMLLFKTYLKYDSSDKKKERLRKAVTALNSVAFVILFVGFVVPLNIGAGISSAITVTSTGLLFLMAQLAGWTWELNGYAAKVPFYNADNLTMREVQSVFQLDPETPQMELNDYIREAVHRKDLAYFSFFLHHFEKRLNGVIYRFLTRNGYDRYDPARFLDYKLEVLHMSRVCRRYGC